MSTQSVVTAITTETGIVTPAVIAGIQAAESAAALSAEAGVVITSQQKHDAVLNGILSGIQTGSGVLAQSGTGQVAAISGLIYLFVSIFNSLGIFHHAAPLPAHPGA